jgi:hypothetical protein
MTGIELTEEEVTLADDLARRRYERYKGAQGQYRNLPAGHRVGAFCEVATDKWLRSEGFDVDPAYRDIDRTRAADIIVLDKGVEVKGQQPHNWKEMGRCFPPGQLRSLQRRAVGVVWGIVDLDARPTIVELVGWSTPGDLAGSEVRATGPSYKPIANHQIPEEQVRPLSELVGALKA